MRVAAIISSLIAVVLAMVWVFQKPALDSAVALAAALAALLSSFFLRRERKEANQMQTVSDSSTAVQAGRDATIRDIK
jgi:hypothetical protein